VPLLRGPRIFTEILYDAFSILWASLLNVSVIYLLGYSASLFLIFPRLLGKKVVLNPDGLEWARAKFAWPIRSLLKAMEKIGVKLSNSIVADSRAIGDYLATSYGIRYVYIPYPCPKQSLTNTGILEKMDLEPYKYVLCVARLEPENNLHLIVEGASVLNERIKLIIVGPLKKTKYCQRLIQQAPTNVKFVGGIYNKEILADLRRNCLFYIHGHSVGGTNPSLLEAMSCGNAVIAYDVCFNREVCGDSALYFRTVNELKCAIQRLCNDEELRRTLQKKAKERCNNYQLGIIVARYAKLFLILHA
jgi:rhamnosyltransferase